MLQNLLTGRHHTRVGHLNQTRKLKQHLSHIQELLRLWTDFWHLLSRYV